LQRFGVAANIPPRGPVTLDPRTTTMTEYEIQPPSLRCAQSGRELKPGELYYSVLSESPAGFTRSDFSADAWTGPPIGAIAFWLSKVPESAGKKRNQLVDDSVILEFFHRLAGEQEAYKINFRYIIGLLLVRKKLLKLASAERDGDRELLVLRSPSSGEQHRVVNPELTEEQLAAVQSEVEKVLQTQVE
jgi:hypothetical protein